MDPGVIICAAMLGESTAILCAALLTQAPPDPKKQTEPLVVIEGVVCEGTELSVDWGRKARRMGARCAKPIKDAEIELASSSGLTLRATSDARGRFSVGPILLSGDPKDVITFASPNHAGMQLTGVGAGDTVFSPGTNTFYVTLPPSSCPLPKKKP